MQGVNLCTCLKLYAKLKAKKEQCSAVKTLHTSHTDAQGHRDMTQTHEWIDRHRYMARTIDEPAATKTEPEGS